MAIWSTLYGLLVGDSSTTANDTNDALAIVPIHSPSVTENESQSRNESYTTTEQEEATYVGSKPDDQTSNNHERQTRTRSTSNRSFQSHRHRSPVKSSTRYGWDSDTSTDDEDDDALLSTSSSSVDGNVNNYHSDLVAKGHTINARSGSVRSRINNKNNDDDDSDYELEHPLGFEEALKYVAQRKRHVNSSGGGRSIYKFSFDDDDWSDSSGSDGDSDTENDHIHLSKPSLSVAGRILARYETKTSLSPNDQEQEEEEEEMFNSMMASFSSMSMGLKLSSHKEQRSRLSQTLCGSNDPVHAIKQRSIQEQLYNERGRTLKDCIPPEWNVLTTYTDPNQRLLELQQHGSSLSSSSSSSLKPGSSDRVVAKYSSLLDSQKSMLKHMSSVVDASRKGDRAVLQHMEKERERVRREESRTKEALQQILKDNEQKARVIREQEKIRDDKLASLREEERQEAVALQREEERIEEERRLEQQKQNEEAEQIRKQQQLQEETRRKEEEEKIRKKKLSEQKEREHILRAQKSISQLNQIRAQVAPFDTLKIQPVPKRRLQYKKLAKGKLNTLNHDSDKIRSVANELVQAIAQARTEDEQLKEQMQSQPQLQLPPEVARGKRYLLDLITSNVVSRVQSEQFNGAKGDGFPIAATIALVASQEKEIASMMTAHIFAACPLAIPNVPKPGESTSANDDGNGDEENEDDENALMESLGMKRDTKTGEYETFDSYLHRMEGLISISAALMCSVPEGHSVMGGYQGGIKWLNRFIVTLPKPPVSPLPIHTAPVLSSFLITAGHMMSRKVPDDFRKFVTYIQEKIIPRLDEGSIGIPSATRLKKVMDGGFDKFYSDLPQGAIPSLYVGSDVSNGSGINNSADSVTTPQTVLSANTSTNFSSPPPAGAAAASSSNTASLSNSNPFGITSGPSPFAPTQAGASTATAASNPFTSPKAQTTQTSATPFNTPGAPTTTRTNSFSATSTPVSNSFFSNNTNTPAVMNTPAKNSFEQAQGLGGGFSMGGGSNLLHSFTSAESSNSVATNTSTNPFSSSASNPFSSAGGNAGTTTNSFSTSNPFSTGGSNISNSNNFSVGNKPKKSAPLCRYYQQGRCNQGENCKFSHDTNDSTPGGGGPFSSHSGAGGGGGGSNKNRPQCRYYAQGKCKNGANCKFSHEGGNSQPQQQQQKSSTPFSAGSGTGGFSTSMPFSSSSFSQSSNSFSNTFNTGGNGFGTSNTTNNNNNSNPSPYGVSSNPFGQQSFNSNTNASPFGQSSNNPFGPPRR